MLSPILRIVLRYLAGFLVAKGLLSAEFGMDLANDADVLALMEIAAGAIIAGATEAFYFVAKKMGWRT